MRTQPYTTQIDPVATPSHVANTVPNVAVIDGGPSWPAKTVTFGVSSVKSKTGIYGAPPLSTRLDGAENLDGFTWFHLEAKSSGGVWWREVMLSANQALNWDVSPFKSFNLSIRYSTLVGFNAWALASEERLAGNQREPAQLAVSVAAPGIYLVPPGAAEVSTTHADAGFAWLSGPLVIPEPMVAGVATPVKGTRYRVTRAAGLGTSWRIHL